MGLPCGGIPRHGLETAGADALYDDPAALLTALPDTPHCSPRCRTPRPGDRAGPARRYVRGQGVLV
ncbi:hypothetical protein [Streptomyces sp. Amel2xC10]|uniref:hypothetical protein n=1 Tax=Streptomyces sp. Amel2xC10 TaxID=1305826 RepID=UPI000A08895B|nr:hypothetical protein SAMN02745830_05741 [Streptomyces sp. Amel2xC10]